MNTATGHLKSIPTRGIAAKLVLVGVVIGAFAIALCLSSWQIGDMLGELTSPSEEGAARAAEGAIWFAPQDPRSRWLLAAALRNDFSPEGQKTASESLKEAVRRSPNQPRWWSELARFYEQSGEYAFAEAAFQRAVALAPEYTLPNWQLGNFYLRQGRVDDAVGPLQTAAKYSSRYQGQVFAISWGYFGGDASMVERFAADDPVSVSSLASFYSGVNRPEDALRTWNRLSDEDKERFKTTATDIARRLFTQHRYLTAAEFARQSGLDKSVRPGAFTNGDFESGIKEPNTFLFDWIATRTDGKVEIGSNAAVAHGSKRSLRVLFRGYTKLEFFDIRQTLAVRPGSRQKIEFWVRTENLRSGSMPLFAVVDAATERSLGVTQPLPTGTNDWQMISMTVDVPENSEGIRVMSVREPCPTECPLTGLFWVDDFRAEELKP